MLITLKELFLPPKIWSFHRFWWSVTVCDSRASLRWPVPLWCWAPPRRFRQISQSYSCGSYPQAWLESLDFSTRLSLSIYLYIYMYIYIYKCVYSYMQSFLSNVIWIIIQSYLYTMIGKSYFLYTIWTNMAFVVVSSYLPPIYIL